MLDSTILTAAGGVLVGLIVKHFWDKVMTPYRTIKDCDLLRNTCSRGFCGDMQVIREVVLELAVKAGIPTEKYKRLTE